MISLPRIALTFLALVACPPASAAPLSVITLEIEGNDGAAMGQQGSVRLAEDGRITCTLTTTEMIEPFATRSRVFDGTTPDLFAPLAEIIQRHGIPGDPPAGPNLAALTTEQGTIHIPPGPDLNGFAAPISSKIGALLFAATDGACLPFG